MRKIAFAAFFALALSVGAALAAASHNDSAVLSTDTTYQNRVKVALVAACVNISAEVITGLTGATPIAVHLKRANYCATVLAAPDSFKVLFALTVATDANVLADATQGGTVALTAGNVAAQAALTTDPHLDAAVAGQLPAYLAVP
jgi:hypothetical protein